MSEQWVPAYVATLMHVQMPHRLEPTWESFWLPQEQEVELRFEPRWEPHEKPTRASRPPACKPRKPRSSKPRNQSHWIDNWREPGRATFSTYLGKRFPHTVFTTGVGAMRITKRLFKLGMGHVQTGLWCRNFGRVRVVRFFKLPQTHPHFYHEDLFRVEVGLE